MGRDSDFDVVDGAGGDLTQQDSAQVVIEGTFNTNRKKNGRKSGRSAHRDGAHTPTGLRPSVADPQGQAAAASHDSSLPSVLHSS